MQPFSWQAEPPLLDIRQLSRSFREGGRVHRVLDRLDARIASGERVAIMGRSGSGKSTLLNLISGIDRADHGAVHIDGVEVTALGEPARTLHRRAHIGFVYQFFNLIPTLDVVENVRLVLDLNGVRGAAARARSLAALTAVGLAERSHSAVEDLSGGEQQRVAIARALAANPHMLMFDEPTSALDPETVGEVLSTMRDLAREGRTMLVVTHEMRFAAEVGTRMIFMDQGKIVEEGKPRDLLARPQTERAQRFLQTIHAG